MKALLVLGMITIPNSFLLSCTHLITTPCFPGFMGYFLLTPCQNPCAGWNIFPDMVLRITIPPGMMWLTLLLLVSLDLEIITFSSLHCLCLCNYQYLFWRKCQLYKDVARSVSMFKELQLLVTFYNLIHGNILSVMVTVGIGQLSIISTYAVIGLYSELSVAQRLYFGFLSFDCFLVMLLCDGGFKAAVNSVSRDILARVRSAPYFINKRIMRRYVRSWPPVKIRLGSTNFYDRETPLNLIAFCISQVVNLLLL